MAEKYRTQTQKNTYTLAHFGKKVKEACRMETGKIVEIFVNL